MRVVLPRPATRSPQSITRSPSMSNFSPRAQQLLAHARAEAVRLNHECVGAEHLILGMLKLGQGGAVTILKRAGLEFDALRAEFEKQMSAQGPKESQGNVPYTPRVKRILAVAGREAGALKHDLIGTEHILLVVMGESDSLAVRVLGQFQFDAAKARQLAGEQFAASASARELKMTAAPSSTTAPAREGKSFVAGVANASPREPVDTEKRYDIFCSDRSTGTTEYRNARFKGVKALFARSTADTLSEFIELELEDGKTICVSKYSILRFQEHGDAPGNKTEP